MMDMNKVYAKLSDPDVIERLSTLSTQAAQSGPRSEAANKFLAELVDSPEELAKLQSDLSNQLAGGENTVAITPAITITLTICAVIFTGITFQQH